ncbi:MULTISPECIES: hypothetical protein [unclassified Pseudovibrio]|uniref:hypothetical protein n=1 Tax=unclassified Pseudovibrio TaxID=2627060 RepID=UPI0007AED3E5|nr:MULTISPECIES: hypothetical protein [unclassified Pseudovibrio]KZK95216.1 Phosphothreonine lyase OspF [Pseudovibrio sp. W74]KZL05067.1 Phosphothreonine lyase OspF [Pseudovibrio sp. Ad14]
MPIDGASGFSPSHFIGGGFDGDAFEPTYDSLPSSVNGDGVTAEGPEKVAQVFRQERAPVFRLANSTPNYNDIKSQNFGDHEGFSYYNLPGVNSFINFGREEGQFKGENHGDKVHISVKKEHLEQAFDAISGLLLSPDSPIDKWKVTNLDSTKGSVDTSNLARRVSDGAQFTLYIRAEEEGEPYTTEQLVKTHQFFEEIEGALLTNWVDEGVKPDSDVSAHHWGYISYRNELNSDRAGGEQQAAFLKQEPVFRALTE